jgi:hypothetical protein
MHPEPDPSRRERYDRFAADSSVYRGLRPIATRRITPYPTGRIQLLDRLLAINCHLRSFNPSGTKAPFRPLAFHGSLATGPHPAMVPLVPAYASFSDSGNATRYRSPSRMPLFNGLACLTGTSSNPKRNSAEDPRDCSSARLSAGCHVGRIMFLP